jgi:L-asparagine transporter-like permease
VDAADCRFRPDVSERWFAARYGALQPGGNPGDFADYHHAGDRHQGVSELNTVIVLVKLSTVVGIFIVLGGYFLLLHPSLARTTGIRSFRPDGHGQFRIGAGIALGAASVFFAYIGFDAVSTAAQEAKNPQKDMPIGILGSLAVCTVLYIVVSLVLTGLVNYKELNVAAPVALGIKVTGVGWGELLVKMGAVFGLATVMLVMLLGQSRVFYLDVEGWSVAEVGGRHSSQVPHAMDFHDHGWSHCGDYAGVPAD